MKYFASVVSLIFLPINLIWEKNHVSGMDFVETFRAGGKSAYKE